MQIADDYVVAMEYTLRGDEGEVLDSSKGRAPMTYLQGHGNIIPGLERAMRGKGVGDTFEVTVEAQQAYGPRHAALMQQVPKDAFPDGSELRPGVRFQAQTDRGPTSVVVTGVEGDMITVDGNHPMAGRRLHFEIEVIQVRAATVEEIEHGHVHGPSGKHSS